MMFRLFAALVAMMIATQPVAAAPAPAISSFEIVEVSSGRYPTPETVGASALVTTKDHGGAYIQVKVLQMGYSSSQTAVMDTYAMTLVKTEYRTNSSGQIIGYYYTYKLTKGFESGTVSVSAVSINTGRRWSDSIRIK